MKHDVLTRAAAPVVLVLTGAACIFYGVTIMAVGSGTLFHVFWYALGAVLFAAAVLVARGAFARMPLGFRRLGGACVGVLVAIVLAAAGCSVSGFWSQGEDDLDYVVVLGAQVYPQGPSTVLQHRLDAARAYLEANPRTVCIVSGGQGPNEVVDEASVMARYLEEHGIAGERILQEPASLNTAQNIANSMRLADLQHARVGIVTNNFHVFRAVGIARKQGMRNACGIAAFTDRWYVPNNVAREALGILKDLACGNL